MDKTRIYRIFCLFFLFPVFSVFAQEYVEITTDTVNIYSSPQKEKIGILFKGNIIEKIEEKDDWIKVKIDAWIPKEEIKISTSTVSPLLLQSFEIKQLPPDENGQEAVLLALELKNTTNFDIRAWRAKLIGKNLFGETIFELKLKGLSKISSQNYTITNFKFINNPLNENEVYDYLINLGEELIVFELSEIEIVN